MRRPPTRKELGLEPRYTAKKFRPYALAIGEATLSWNDLHVELGMLFVTVSGGGYANYYFELWNSLTNDGAKRNILMAAAKASLKSISRSEVDFGQDTGTGRYQEHSYACIFNIYTDRKHRISQCMARRSLRPKIAGL